MDCSTSRRRATSLRERRVKVRHLFSLALRCFETDRLPFALADTIQALADANQAAFAQLRNVVVKHLEKNGRRWVSMSSLFAFMGV